MEHCYSLPDVELGETVSSWTKGSALASSRIFRANIITEENDKCGVLISVPINALASGEN